MSEVEVLRSTGDLLLALILSLVGMVVAAWLVFAVITSLVALCYVILGKPRN